MEYHRGSGGKGSTVSSYEERSTISSGDSSRTVAIYICNDAIWKSPSARSNESRDRIVFGH